MVLLFNLIFLMLILRLSFEKKMMSIFLYKHWPGLITLQHLLFWLTFIAVNTYFYIHLFGFQQGLFRLIFMLFINIPLYHLCFSKLVPEYYQTKRYPEYIRYTAVAFVLSCLFRILIEPEIFQTNAIIQSSLLLLIYVTQTIIVLISSLLGISKYKLIVENELAKLEIRKREADLDLVKSKINPHFLLNTLNNIYSHSYVQGSSSANLIMQLSLLLQYTTYEVGRKRIPVEKEIQMINALSSLYQLKYNQQLNFIFNYKPNALLEFIEVPPTIYFTLVENALKYSSLGIDVNAFIVATLELTDKELSFKITNSKSSFAPREANEQYKGLGLSVLKSIIEHEYDSSYNLSHVDSEKEYTTTLTIDL
jgi:two-component system LytT family sensor kinase